MVVSGNASMLSSADFPTTNCPPQTTAVVVAKSTPSVVVLVLTRVPSLACSISSFNEAGDAGISWRDYVRATPMVMRPT